MRPQNIYTVKDSVECLPGSGEPITKYLDGLFSRVSSEVAKLKEPVDWLVVNSGSLNEVSFYSQDMFEERLESALRVHDPKISVIRCHATSFGGAISNKNISKWIEKRLDQENVQLNYLNPTDLELSFVGYHLDVER